MEGQVFVPYTGIGGINMITNTFASKIDGSTQDSDQWGSGTKVMNVSWSFPGGIANTPNPDKSGQGNWRFAVTGEEGSAGHQLDGDDTIALWLQEELESPYWSPGRKYSVEEVQGNNPEIQKDINDLVFKYVNYLLMMGVGYEGFIQTFGPYGTKCATFL